MFKELTRAFRISFSLKNTYRVNSILYSIRQFPFIGKLLPVSLYQNQALKVLANLIAALWELSTAFVGKALYLFLVTILGGIIFEPASPSQFYLHTLFFLTIAGSYLNTYMFNPTNDKYYAIFLMRMDAKLYTLANYTYDIAKVIIGFLPFTLITGLIAGVPVVLCLLFPFFIAGCKVTSAGLALVKYKKTGKHSNENLPPIGGWILLAILLAAAYSLPASGILLPVPVIAAAMILVIALGVGAAFYIRGFTLYREMYQKLLAEGRNTISATKTIARDQSRKSISQDATITSHRKGFEYFNELFIKRHRKILWGPSLKTTFISLGIVAVLAIAVVASPFIKDTTNDVLVSLLPYFIFLMYMINRGTYFTQALFMNCDHSMLTYSFYKQPKSILKLFTIRLREIIKVNIIPALVIGGGLSLVLYLSGGVDTPLNYLVIPVYILTLSVFFSVHYLMLYYLLQPYNAGTELKSSTYKIATTITYFVCFGIMQVDITFNYIFGLLVAAFCIIYSVFACILVYRLAPKTFKIRN